MDMSGTARTWQMKRELTALEYVERNQPAAERAQRRAGLDPAVASKAVKTVRPALISMPA